MTKDEMIVMLTTKILNAEILELKLIKELEKANDELDSYIGYISDIKLKIGYIGHPGNLVDIITGWS